MSSWDPGLYQDDIAAEVRDFYIDKLHRGKTGIEITQELLHNFSELLEDSDDSAVFWFALADTQWKLGRIESYVKNQALSYIDNGNDIKCWSAESPKDAKKRLKILTDLKNRLMSQPPPEKKISQYKIYHCEWSIGDVFAYKLESELAKEKGLYGKFILIRKIDENTWFPGHTVPIVYIKITESDRLPANIDEYNHEEYIQTGSTRYENRFLPIDARRAQQDIEEKSKLIYNVDEFGYLPQFRVTLINTSKKIIPKKLIYLGNFKDSLPPQIEFIPHSKANIKPIMWKNFDKTFESEIISCYFGFNNREYPIYQDKTVNCQF